MKFKLEAGLWCLVAVLLAALLMVDRPATAVLANDSGGRTAAISTGGSFFVVDTENQWIGLYAQPGIQGPRLISAQNYQNASFLAQLKADSDKEGCEAAPGWTVIQTDARLKELTEQLKPPPTRR